MNWRLVYAPDKWIVFRNWAGVWLYHAGVFVSIEQHPMMEVGIWELPKTWEPVL